MWMKNVKHFQIAKVQPQLLSTCLITCQFQPGVACKSVDIIYNVLYINQAFPFFFRISRKPYLNLCSFNWLKRRRNLVKYLTPSGSLTLNIDLLLGLIKERSLLLKTTIDSEFCISGASCDHSDREFGKKEYLKQSVLQLKKVSVSCVYHKTFH